MSQSLQSQCYYVRVWAAAGPLVWQGCIGDPISSTLPTKVVVAIYGHDDQMIARGVGLKGYNEVVCVWPNHDIPGNEVVAYHVQFNTGKVSIYVSGSGSAQSSSVVHAEATEQLHARLGQYPAITNCEGTIVSVMSRVTAITDGFGTHIVDYQMPFNAFLKPRTPLNRCNADEFLAKLWTLAAPPPGQGAEVRHLAIALGLFPLATEYVWDTTSTGAATDRWDDMLVTENGDCEDIMRYMVQAYADLRASVDPRLEEARALANQYTILASIGNFKLDQFDPDRSCGVGMFPHCKCYLVPKGTVLAFGAKQVWLAEGVRTFTPEETNKIYHAELQVFEPLGDTPHSCYLVVNNNRRGVSLAEIRAGRATLVPVWARFNLDMSAYDQLRPGLVYPNTVSNGDPDRYNSRRKWGKHGVYSMPLTSKCSVKYNLD